MLENVIRSNGGAPLRQRWSYRASILVVVAILAGPSFAQSSLPVEVQADMIQKGIIEALKTEDIEAALRGFDEYRALKIPISPSLLFVEAKAAEQAGDPFRAVIALEEYFKVATRDDIRYPGALTQYGRLVEMPDVKVALGARKVENERLDRIAKGDAIRAEIKREEAAYYERKKRCAGLEADYEQKRDKWVKCVNRFKGPFGNCDTENEQYRVASQASLSCTQSEQWLKRTNELEASLAELNEGVQ